MVCNDICRLIFILCERANIPCSYVTGHWVSTGGYHAVLKVKLNGYEYWSDPTYDMVHGNEEQTYRMLMVNLNGFDVEDDKSWRFLWP